MTFGANYRRNGVPPQSATPVALIALTMGVMLLCGCAAERPPGPAERLGRTIDQLTQDIKDISREYEESEAAQRKNEGELPYRRHLDEEQSAPAPENSGRNRDRYRPLPADRRYDNYR